MPMWVLDPCLRTLSIVLLNRDGHILIQLVFRVDQVQLLIEQLGLGQDVLAGVGDNVGDGNSDQDHVSGPGTLCKLNH